MNDRGIDTNPNPNGWYASLVWPFLGYYVEIRGAQSNMHARVMCNQDRRMQRLWCSIYTLDRVEENIAHYGGTILRIEELDADQYWEGDDAQM